MKNFILCTLILLVNIVNLFFMFSLCAELVNLPSTIPNIIGFILMPVYVILATITTSFLFEKVIK